MLARIKGGRSTLLLQKANCNLSSEAVSHGERASTPSSLIEDHAMSSLLRAEQWVEMVSIIETANQNTTHMLLSWQHHSTKLPTLKRSTTV
jgi:hypothetical protein